MVRLNVTPLRNGSLLSPSLLYLYADDIINNLQINLPEHSMICYSAVATLLLSDAQGEPGKWLASVSYTHLSYSVLVRLGPFDHQSSIIYDLDYSGFFFG